MKVEHERIDIVVMFLVVFFLFTILKSTQVGGHFHSFHLYHSLLCACSENEKNKLTRTELINLNDI